MPNLDGNSGDEAEDKREFNNYVTNTDVIKPSSDSKSSLGGDIAAKTLKFNTETQIMKERSAQLHHSLTGSPLKRMVLNKAPSKEEQPLPGLGHA